MNKLVLIKERYDLEAVADPKNSDIIYLEAPVAVFGEKNNNNRVYEESNYLPLINELADKIKGNNLTGELDHPGERLEVYLSNVSHKVEKLEYDEGSRTVRAKIRLIEGTTAGNNAIALHKAGVNLGISSRAIGVIKEGKALLKKIITFDIVSTPGFKSAMLKPINESLGFDSDATDFAIYEITDEKYLKKYSYLLESDENNNDDNMKYTEEIKAIQEALKGLKEEVSSVNDKLESFTEYNQKHIANLNEFAAGILESKEDIERFKESFIEYNEKETKKLRTLKESVDIIDETMDTFIKMYEAHSEIETGKLNAFVNHQHEETQKLNEFVNHQHEETQKLNEFVNHQHEETQKLNAIVEYLDKQSGILENFVDLQDKETQKLNKFVDWTEKNLKELYENAEFKSFINNKNQLNVDLTKISESVDNVLESVRKQKTFKTNVLSKYPFLEQITEEKQQEFLSLDDSRKTMIVNAINREESINESKILTIFEDLKSKEAPIWLAKASEDYQKLWSTLSESQKTKIVKLGNMRDFKSEEDIITFWDGLKLNEELKVIKENQDIQFNLENAINDVNKIKDDWKLGYSKDYINQIKEQIKRNK